MRYVGRGVVDGVFYLSDTVGLPLDLIVDCLREHALVAAWDCYIRDARLAGWTDRTIYRKLIEQGLPEDRIMRTLVNLSAT